MTEIRKSLEHLNLELGYFLGFGIWNLGFETDEGSSGKN